MANKSKPTSLAARVEAERKKIEALELKIAKLQEQEMQRIGKIAEAAGCLDVAISDEEYKIAFESLVKSKQSSNEPVGNARASNDPANSSLAHA